MEEYEDYVKNQVKKISHYLPIYLKDISFSGKVPGLLDYLYDQRYCDESLKIFETQLFESVMAHKNLKNTTYIGEEKLFYEHLSEVICSN